MADPRTFVLIGNFEDNITPALENINKSVASFKRTMASLTTKKGGGYNDVTKSVGKLVSAQRHLKEAIEGVGGAAKSATQDLKDYKSMLGKVSSAHYHIKKSGTAAGNAQKKFWSGAEKELDDYRRKLEALQRQTKINPYQSLTGTRRQGRRAVQSSPGVAPVVSRRATMDRQASRGRSRGEFDFNMGAFSFGMSLGQGLAQPITNAVFSGFNLGVGLLSKTLNYIQGGFAERMEDQMSDLQAAGGYYSISKRQKNPMFTSLQASIRFTQKTNDILERLAGDLPGTTEDYVRVSKRIGDSVMRVVDADTKGSIEFARQLMMEGGNTEAYRGVNLDGPQARQGATQVILGELTKKSVLAGFGGTTGRGGMAGNYGLPALMERLITNPDFSMAQLRQYIAVSGDPKIMAALERAVPELKKAGNNMLQRLKIINKAMDEIATPEQIAAMRKSLMGVFEAFRSSLFSPGTGLFGLGRKLGDEADKADKLLQPMTDEFGRLVKEYEENGKTMYRVVQTLDEASKQSMGVFDMFADIVSNFAAVIKPIVDNLYLIWDPLTGLGEVLGGIREASILTLNLFRRYDKALSNEVKALMDSGQKDLAESLGSTKNLRASLLTIFDTFTELGAISESDFKGIRAFLIDPTKGLKDFVGLVKEAVVTFFNSEETGGRFGKAIGEALREIVISLSEFTGFISQLGTTELVKGLMDGFGEKGKTALFKIFEDIYKMLFDALTAVLTNIDWRVYALVGLGLAIPATIQGVTMSLAQGITTVIRNLGDDALNLLTKSGKNAKITDAVAEIADDAKKVADASREARIAAMQGLPDGGPKGGGARVTKGKGTKGAKTKGAPVTSSGGKGTSARYQRVLREGTVTRSGVGITTSDDAVRGGAKVTGIPEPTAKAAPKPSAFKNISKWLLGVDESILGRPLINLVKNIRTSLSGLVGKLATLKPMFSSFNMFIDVLLDGLGMLVKGIPGIKQLDNFIEEWMDLGFKPAAGNAAKGFKNFFGNMKGGLAGLLGKGKGLLGGLLGGAKGLGGGLKGLFGKGLKGLGKFGTVATVGVGIVEALMSLFSGDSLGTALGKGAGPVLGTIIGTALLGPIGGLIGGWIGSMEAVTEPLGQTFDSIMQTVTVTFEFLAQVGGDLLGVLNGLGKSLFGAGEGFDALKFMIFALMSPFRLLELGIRGLYVLYLQMKANLGLASKEERETLEKEKVTLNRRREQFVIEGEERRGVSKEEQLKKAKADLASLTAEREALKNKPGRKPPRAYRGPSDAEKNLQLRIEMLEGQIKDEARPKGTKAIRNGKNVEWDGSRWVEPTGQPDAKDVPKDIAGTYETTKEQVKGITEVGKKTEQTTGAVKELTAKITAQSSVQSTVVAIYNLLASGSLRVQGNLGNLNINGGGGNPPRTDKLPRPGESTKDFIDRLYEWPTATEPKKVSTNTLRAQGTATGDTILTTNITVNGANQDADEIATLVATKFSDAVEKLRSSNVIFT